MFQKFRGTPDQLEKRLRNLVSDFYKEQVLPFVGKLDDQNVPDYSLLIAARHKYETKLWNVDGKLVTDSELPFDCIGIGESVATALLNRLYPMHPTLDSIAVLAAYVIYRVKSSVVTNPAEKNRRGNSKCRRLHWLCSESPRAEHATTVDKIRLDEPAASNFAFQFQLCVKHDTQHAALEVGVSTGKLAKRTSCKRSILSSTMVRTSLGF
jgi:hypothetical protein